MFDIMCRNEESQDCDNCLLFNQYNLQLAKEKIKILSNRLKMSKQHNRENRQKLLSLYNKADKVAKHWHEMWLSTFLNN